jgi:hypothetical protein
MAVNYSFRPEDTKFLKHCHYSTGFASNPVTRTNSNFPFFPYRAVLDCIVMQLPVWDSIQCALNGVSPGTKRLGCQTDHSPPSSVKVTSEWNCKMRLKCAGTRAETRFRLSVKRTSPFKSAGASVQSTTGSRGVRISSSNAGYTKLRGSVKCTGYPLHSSVSSSLPLPCVTVCHHVSTGLYLRVPRLHSVRRDSSSFVFCHATSSLRARSTAMHYCDRFCICYCIRAQRCLFGSACEIDAPSE